MGGKKKTTVGYRYGMGLHFALCHGPVDQLIEIKAGDRSAWSTALTASGAFTIDQPQLFGGDEREGGISGPAYLLMGDAAQTLPPALSADMSGIEVAFRGLTTLFFNGLVTSNNPYIKPWDFRVRRIINGWSINGEETTAWYPEKAAISNASIANVSTTDDWEFQQLAFHASPGYTNLTIPPSGYSTGPAPFGFGPIFGETPPIATSWDRWSVLWIRKTIELPPGATASITVFVESGAVVFANGVEIGSLNRDNTPTITFNPPATFAIPRATPETTESITIAIKAFDEAPSTGSTTYLRVFVTATGIETMNPAHIIYQALVDDRMPLCFGTAQLSDSSFRAAADVYFAEGLGLCLAWTQQTTIGDFIQQVLEHCRSLLYVDPTDGLFNLKPLRADYDPDALAVYDEATIIAYESFTGASADELTSTVEVVYRDVETAQDSTVTVQNLGLLQQQFGAPTETVQLPGLPTADLAARAAQAILDEKSLPLKRHRVRLTRAAAGLKPGDVIKFSWAKLGISESIVRVLAVNRGTLRDGAVVIEAIDDVFGFPLTSYIAPQPVGYEPFDPAPVPIVQQAVIELPYWTAALYEGSAFANGVDVDSGYLAPLAARNASNAQVYRIYSRIDPADFEDQDIGNFVPYAALDAAIDEQATTLELVDDIDLDQVEVGDLAILDTGRATEEWVLVTGVTISPPSVEVSRAVLDTTARSHDAGTTVFFADGFASQDSTERATGQEVDFKLATISTGGELDIDLATEISGETDQRIARPYPPGNVAINGEAWPTTLSGALTVTWAHRDRLQQTAYVVEQSEGDIGPEAGTTYNVYAYDVTTDMLLDSDTGLTGTSWSPTVPDAFPLRIEIETERDGITSWQAQIRTFAYFSPDVSGRITDNADEAARETDDGELRITD